MSTRTLRIGTRGSPLALWQARTTQAELRTRGVESELVVVKTSGDRLQEAPLATHGGKRLFVKELEDALQRHEVDLAVHSSKDMPVESAPGLTVVAVLPRAIANDAVVLPHLTGTAAADVGSLDDLRVLLPSPVVVGTSSIRRTALIRRLLPHVSCAPVRGNLDTRLRKLDERDYGALILAAAGLTRLDLSHRISWLLPLDIFVPAPGQGVIAIETRRDDQTVRHTLETLNHAPTAVAFKAERAVVEHLGGGCQTPIGAHAVTTSDGQLRLAATVVSPDGQQRVDAHAEGTWTMSEALGRRVAEALLSQGARAILQALPSS